MIKFAQRSFCLLILFSIANVVFAFGEKKPAVNWLTPEAMQAQMDQEARPIIVDVFTDWCYYCKVMDKTTWKNDSVSAFVNDHFYPVKINAESVESYDWKGVKYEYEPKYKVNMLAVKLLAGNMTYPSLVIIPVHGEPEVIAGAFSPKELEMILRFYGEGLNEKMTPDDYMKRFSGKWK